MPTKVILINTQLTKEDLLTNIPQWGIMNMLLDTILGYNKKEANMAKCSNPHCKCVNCTCGDNCTCTEDKCNCPPECNEHPKK